MAAKISFPRSNTEKMAALLVSHSALDALREKRKLLFRRLSARPSIMVRSSINLRTTFTKGLLFCFRPRVSPRPSVFSVPPVSSQLRWLLRRNVTLSTPAFRALKNIMDKARLLDFLARESHSSVASNAEKIVSNWLDHKAIQTRKSRDEAASMKCFSKGRTLENSFLHSCERY
jgi:hypothetical protein